MKRIILVLKIAAIFSLSGCAAGALVTRAGIGSMAARGLMGEVLATRAIAGSELASLTRMAATTNAMGEVSAASSIATNNLFRRLSLKYTKGQSPLIYAEGITEPVAHVFTRKGNMRFIGSSELVPIPNNVFSVTGNGIILRQGSGINFSSTGHQVFKRDLVIKLAEKNGWYKIQIARNPNPITGWVKAAYLIPLALLDDSDAIYTEQEIVQVSVPKPKEYDCAEMLTGHYSFTNKTNKKLTVMLYPASTPDQYIGNPGENYSQMITLTGNEMKSIYRLPATVFKYRILEELERGSLLTGQIDYYGQIMVEKCKTHNLDIK
ncbi:MAG: SH3 domain-containing protein [Pedobacter sp.]|nr:MAG: SH3 domain-containing protein [Pedobacter sp.]